MLSSGRATASSSWYGQGGASTQREPIDALVLIRVLAQLLDDRLAHFLMAIRAFVQLISERSELAVPVPSHHLPLQ